MSDHGGEGMLYRLDGDGHQVDAFAVRDGRLSIGPPAPWLDYETESVLDVMRGGEMTMTLDPATVPDLLAFFFCQLDDHEHDGRTCVPSWIRLGED